jgi:Flp pilus assembly protein TadD
MKNVRPRPGQRPVARTASPEGAEVSQPRVAPPRLQASIQVAAAQSASLRAVSPPPAAALISAQPNSSANVKALAPRAKAPLGRRNASKYVKEDLVAVSEIAYHYLFNGGLGLALSLYDGLVAVAPDEPQFALGLGLTHDQLGDRDEAMRWYRHAAELDPGDPQADLNSAELYIEVQDWARARQLLMRSANKARNRHDAALERKAVALIRHLETVA